MGQIPKFQMTPFRFSTARRKTQWGGLKVWERSGVPPPISHRLIDPLLQRESHRGMTLPSRQVSWTIGLGSEGIPLNLPIESSAQLGPSGSPCQLDRSISGSVSFEDSPVSVSPHSDALRRFMTKMTAMEK